MYRDLLDHVCGHGPARARVLAGANDGPARLLVGGRGRIASARGPAAGTFMSGRRTTAARCSWPGTSPLHRPRWNRLVASESGCAAHVDVRLEASTEGVLLKARGANAFLFAQLSLTLESADASPRATSTRTGPRAAQIVLDLEPRFGGLSSGPLLLT